MWFYVFKSQTGEVSIGSELRNRECAYMSQTYSDCVRFAKVLATSVGNFPPCRNAFPSVNARGSGKACQQSALSLYPSIDNRSLIVHNTDHVPQRRYFGKK